jgi:hypothetical protein
VKESSSHKLKKFGLTLAFALSLSGLSACQKNIFESNSPNVTSLRDIPALRLNFRFESDVPAPPAKDQNAQTDEKNTAIQTDFDQNRPQESLEKTISSPDKKRILVVYRKFGDLESTYRLDMYSGDGKLVNKITPNGLAVYYPDTIVWSPDNNNVAFVGMIRTGQVVPTPLPDAPIPPSLDEANSNATESNSNLNSNLSTPGDNNKQVLTFRTEQIYICNADGSDVKPITQNEGLIYFYFVWSPDSSALAALATTWKEWKYWENQAKLKGEVYNPSGRPRLVEKTGRIRLLDDNLTVVRPVWSPDSAKVAYGFDKEVRIYDAIGNTPTQAAIPLRNQLLISSKKYDDQESLKEAGNSNVIENSNSNSKANSKANSNTNVQPLSTPTDVNALPDERTLLSFQPIIQLEWSEDKLLYLQTGFIKEFIGADAIHNARNHLRWHRLLLSPQVTK